MLGPGLYDPKMETVYKKVPSPMIGLKGKPPNKSLKKYMENFINRILVHPDQDAIEGAKIRSTSLIAHEPKSHAIFTSNTPRLA